MSIDDFIRKLNADVYKCIYGDISLIQNSLQLIALCSAKYLKTNNIDDYVQAQKYAAYSLELLESRMNKTEDYFLFCKIREILTFVSDIEKSDEKTCDLFIIFKNQSEKLGVGNNFQAMLANFLLRLLFQNFISEELLPGLAKIFKSVEETTMIEIFFELELLLRISLHRDQSFQLKPIIDFIKFDQ